MASSRDQILNKLRAARRPFEDAPPRPDEYLPVIAVEDSSPAALTERFVREMELLKGTAFVVKDDGEACSRVLELLQTHSVHQVLTWDFRYVPVVGLEDALRANGISITTPKMHEERSPEFVTHLGNAGAGITGADAAIAMTGTLVLSSGEGKGRIPTVLPPIWISVVTIDQLVPRIEDWLAAERARGMATIHERANVAFVTGPSRTGDIEMQLVLGVHGPGTQYVILKQS